MMLKTSQPPPASGFSNTSAISPFGALAGNKSPLKDPVVFTKSSSPEPPQTSSEAFQLSGFAALANSPSPFGALGGSNDDATSNPPLKSFASPFGKFGPQNGAQAPQTGSAFGKATTSAFGSSSSGFGTLGGSSFGGGFGSSGGFGSGTKLTSFAAPIGGKPLGGGKSKPFGAPQESDEEGSEGSEAGDEDGEEQPDQKEVEGSQANGHFQLQTEGKSAPPPPRFSQLARN
jgi:Ran-binding protein 3